MDVGVIAGVCSLIALLVIGFRLLRLIRVAKSIQILRAIPEPSPGHWFWGHADVFADRSRIEERRREWLPRFPRIQRLMITQFIPIISLVNAATASVLLRSNAPKAKFTYSFLAPWLGGSLLLSNGRKWARDRRLLTNCFHMDILRSYVDVYQDACRVMLQRWAAASARGESVDVTSSVTLLTLDIILRCAMGFESNCQEEGNSEKSKAAEYVHAMDIAMPKITKRIATPLQHNDLIYFNLTADGKEFREQLKIIHGMGEHLIAERREALGSVLTDASERSAHQCRDFLDVLLTVRDEDGNGLSDLEIREQVDTFLFAGHDTTSSALQSALYHLATYAEMQERCRSEVRGILERTDRTVMGALTHEDLADMTYMTQFLKESMRFNTPIPYVNRTWDEDVTIDDYHIPAGTESELCISDIHRNEEQWTDPGTFDPERFSPERSQARHPFAFIPFSAGPRNCIGQNLAMDEMRVILAAILVKFSVHLDPSEPTPKWHISGVAQPEVNIKLRLAEVSS